MFHSLRSRMMIIIFVTFFVPVCICAFFLIAEMEHALYQEKQNKLFGVARILDEHLQGSYQDMLPQQADRQSMIEYLNRQLRDYTDEVASAYPGIGVGYYDRELDAIITYGPSDVYQDKVGLSIGAGHEGRQVMETGQPMVQKGDLVRGNVMNAMVPMIREGQVIGYIWANELAQDIENQIFSIERHIYGTIAVGLIIGIFFVMVIVDKLVRDIEKVKGGVLDLRKDLTHPVARPAGEIGEIAEAINCVVKDIAIRKQLEEKVMRAEQLAAIGEMAAGLAHEIRNPLMSIKGFAELIQEDDDGKFHNYVNVIIRESQKISRLTEKLMCLSKPIDVGSALVDVNLVLLEAIDVVENEARHKGIEIKSSLAHSMPEIFINQEQLGQIFINLLMNAMQAIKKDGKIMVASHITGQEVQISIEDNGCGIAPENIDKIFNPFFTTKETGTGLGLTVVYQLVEQWKGKIYVNSTIGKGSIFTIVLPVGGEADVC
jgi:signal transduction histidine kinase